MPSAKAPLHQPAPSPSHRIVPLPAAFSDSRGAIQTLVEGGFSAAQIITSKAGTVRSNHYHKTDWHYLYVLSGSMRYLHRPVGSKQEPESAIVGAGQLVYTPPLVEHATEFLEDTVLLNLAGGARDQSSYEADLVRVELIKPKN